MEWVDLVQSVGFPIVCCFFLFKQNKELTNALNNLSSAIKGVDKRLKKIETKVGIEYEEDEE